MANKQTVQVVSPGSENYDVTLAKGRPVARFDWENFAKHYNGAKVGSVLIAAVAHPKLSNIVKVLSGRSLEKHIDFVATISDNEQNKAVYITKKTRKKLKYLNEL